LRPVAAAWVLRQRPLAGDGVASGESARAGRRLALTTTARGQRFNGGDGATRSWC
jgi:hypothetical protein